MHDEGARRRKALKMASVLRHFLGREHLDGLRLLDLGSSTGFIADELRETGATVFGIDIDVGGLVSAHRRFGAALPLVCGDGSSLPFPSRSVDLVIFNHIYEHVVDADAVMAEIERVLRPDGLVYLGFANRYGIMEPHYRLPFLSWLPYGVADRYMKVTGRGDRYYERFRSRRRLLDMCRGLAVWDYTYTVLSEPQEFFAEDMVPSPLGRAPSWIWRTLAPILPTFIWIGTPGRKRPGGSATSSSPVLLKSRLLDLSDSQL